MDKTPITSNKEADAIYMNDDGEAATVARPRFSGQNISLQWYLNGICILYGFAGGQIEVKIKRKKSKQRKNNR